MARLGGPRQFRGSMSHLKQAVISPYPNLLRDFTVSTDPSLLGNEAQDLRMVRATEDPWKINGLIDNLSNC